MSAYKCNLLIPGAAKSASSSLFAMLGHHPEICLSDPKELHYFSFDEFYDQGPEYFNGFFSAKANARYYCEGSQGYMVHEHSLERIREVLDSPKAIFILRDPVERAISHYRWHLALGVQSDDLITACKTIGENTEFKFNKHTGKLRDYGGYLGFSRYTKHIPRWQAALGTQNVLMVRFETFKSDAASVMDECFQFLGLAPVAMPQTEKSNATNSVMPLRTLYYLRMITDLTPNFLKNRFYKKAGALVKQQLRPPPPRKVSDEERAYLEEVLADEMAYYNGLWR